MRKLFFILLFVAVVQLGFAQGQVITQHSTALSSLFMEEESDSISPWQLNANVNLNIQQIGLINWTAGGEPSIGLGAIVEGNAKYEKEGLVWESGASVAYGILRQGDDSRRFEKTDDNLSISSRYSQKFSEQVLMTSQLLLRTQMDEGYKIENGERVLISDFLAPGYLQASHGITYRDGDNVNLTLSPFSGRFTFVLNDSLANTGAFGVPIGQKMRSEAGISFTGILKKKIIENVNFRLNANLFSNYERFPSTVVNLSALFVLKVNNYIGANISTNLIYDEDVLINFDDGSQGAGVQLKNVINIGFNMSF